jgi:hypothetical protein
MDPLRYAVLALAALWATAALAADNVAVTLNASVVPVCRFFTAAPVVNVRNTGASGSNINPSLATTATGSAVILYRCTNGIAPTFAVPTSATLTCSACGGSPTLIASIASTNNGAGRGFGTGGGRNRRLTITGTIAPAVFQDAHVGAYSGTMTVTVTP